MKYALLFAFIFTLSACETLKRPSSNPSTMSSDTLCYRAAGAKKDDGIKDEIRARGLDCSRIVEDDPLLYPRRY